MAAASPHASLSHFHSQSHNCSTSASAPASFSRITSRYISYTRASTHDGHNYEHRHDHHHDHRKDERARVSRRRPDPYRTLGLTHEATEQDIRKAYRRLALKFHPDVCKADSSTAKFTQISNAYQTIMDCLKGDGDLYVIHPSSGYDNVQPEQMMGVNDDRWEDWEEWMGWEGAGIRDYSSHINHSI